MEKQARKRRIIWAVDAFEETAPERASSYAVLKQLAANARCHIEPVYVLSPDGLDLSFASSDPWLDSYVPAARKAMAHLTRGLRLRGLAPPRVLTQLSPSLTRSVRTLVDHAVKSGAGVIVAGTHARKGITRLFLGSFTETLLLYSKVPVLVAGPNAVAAPVERIVFATDLSEKSRKVLPRVIELARDFGAELIIYHALEHPIAPIIQSGVYLVGGGWIPVTDYMSRLEELRTQEAERWAALAQRKGVHAEVEIGPSSRGTATSILREAKARKAGLIAMAGESGPVAAAVVGSVARNVVRGATCPVWVMRS